MSSKEMVIEHPWDAALVEQLNAAGIRHRRLSSLEHRQCEQDWRRVYGDAFRPGLRHREGAKAVHELLNEAPGEWLLVPFLSNVRGTPIHVMSPRLSAFACVGPLVDLTDLSDSEFYVSPPDLAWTFVRTHEDFSLGGPYFVRAECVAPLGDAKAT